MTHRVKHTANGIGRNTPDTFTMEASIVLFIFVAIKSVEWHLQNRDSTSRPLLQKKDTPTHPSTPRYAPI